MKISLIGNGVSPNILTFFYLFIIGFIYRPYMLTPRSGRQVRESGTQAPSQGFSSASDRPFVFERLVCNLSTQTTGVNYTALYDHSLLQSYSAQPTLLACQCRGPIIKSQMCSGDRGIEPLTLRTGNPVYNYQTTKAFLFVFNMKVND